MAREEAADKEARDAEGDVDKPPRHVRLPAFRTARSISGKFPEILWDYGTPDRRIFH
jgi:hypothetical protein